MPIIEWFHYTFKCIQMQCFTDFITMHMQNVWRKHKSRRRERGENGEEDSHPPSLPFKASQGHVMLC